LKMANWIVPGHGPMFKSTGVPPVVKETIVKTKLRRKKQKVVVNCKKCRKPLPEEDRCDCRPWLCFRCCECGIDCELCSCSHRKKNYE